MPFSDRLLGTGAGTERRFTAKEDRDTFCLRGRQTGLHWTWGKVRHCPEKQASGQVSPDEGVGKPGTAAGGL